VYVCVARTDASALTEGLDDNLGPPRAVRGQQEPRHPPVYPRPPREADPAWCHPGRLHDTPHHGEAHRLTTRHQAEDAGRQLRSLLKPDDTIQFFTSPYRRTRETTEGILRTLTSDDPTPSPFPRNKIKVFEEPRLREQDFGNFQPCSAEMERMWQERADYGHFFYRIPDGESAADAYDRVSGFNESLWRQFGDEDFPSVCVLVTHGLMTRVFLMKW
jgi:broad specificity phosphatase PhoE